MTEPPNQPEMPSVPPYPQPPPQSYGGYPAPPPMPYGAPAPPPPSALRNGMGTAALVFAIIAVISCWTVLGGVIFGFVAVVLGILGVKRVGRGEANNRGVAIAGIVLGALALLACLAFIPIYIAIGNFLGDAGVVDYYECMTDAGQDQTAQDQCTERFTENIETKFSVTLTTGPGG